MSKNYFVAKYYVLVTVGIKMVVLWLITEICKKGIFGLRSISRYIYFLYFLEYALMDILWLQTKST